jgi:hypothetical protein
MTHPAVVRKGAEIHPLGIGAGLQFSRTVSCSLFVNKSQTCRKLTRDDCPWSPNTLPLHLCFASCSSVHLSSWHSWITSARPLESSSRMGGFVRVGFSNFIGSVDTGLEIPGFLDYLVNSCRQSLVVSPVPRCKQLDSTNDEDQGVTRNSVTQLRS